MLSRNVNQKESDKQIKCKFMKLVGEVGTIVERMQYFKSEKV